MGRKRTYGSFLQLDDLSGKEMYQNLYRFNLGRMAILFFMQEAGYKRIYEPYYLCDSMDKVFEKNGIEIRKYHIRPDLLVDETTLPNTMDKDELLLIVNYFGILEEEKVKAYKSKYGNVLLDNTQAFFFEPVQGIDAVYTCRKWFGVADGAYLYTERELNGYDGLSDDFSAERMSHILRKYENENADYYEEYSRIEADYENEKVKKMSLLTRNIMSAINYQEAAERRRKNYAVLEGMLDGEKTLSWEKNENAVPFMYPFYSENAMKIKKELLKYRCFLPTLWPNVLGMEKNCLEYKLAENLLLLPCDQRYSEDDIRELGNLVLKIFSEIR